MDAEQNGLEIGRFTPLALEGKIVGLLATVTGGEGAVEQLEARGGMHGTIMTMYISMKFGAGPVAKNADLPPTKQRLERRFRS